MKYYLTYALDTCIEELEARSLWAITIGTILVSSVVHGLSVRPFVRRFEGDDDVED